MMARHYQIGLLVFSQMMIIACLGMSDPYWPLIIRHFNAGLSNTDLQFWTALVYGIPFLGTIVSIPFWGWIGQQVGYKKMILRASFALALTQILIGFCTSPILIFFIRLIQGLFAGFTAAAQAWAISTSNDESHSCIISWIQSAMAVGTVLGPIIGGIIVNYYSYSAIFFSSGFVFLSIFLILQYSLDEVPKEKIIKKDLGLRKQFLSQNIFYFLFLICFTQAARWMSSSYFALYAIDRLAGSNLTVGLLYSMIAMGIFLASPKWGDVIDKKLDQGLSLKYIFISILLIASLMQACFAWSTSLYTAVLFAFIWGICLSAANLIPFTLLIRESKDKNVGGVIGLANSASKLGNLLGVLSGAFIYAQTNFTYSFILIGLVYFLLSLVLFVKDMHFVPMSIDARVKV